MMPPAHRQAEMPKRTTPIWCFTRLPNPAWITGPLFGKELRVSSRRRRNYVLRFVYVALLTVFVAILWISIVETSASTTFQKSRMALIGKTVVRTITMFQFIALQLIAVIMLSTSISDEIHHRTLGLLMTTPISSLQIITGKLLSKLLQLVLLLAISMPLLAVVRVFGGVPWGYLLSSLCITLTAVLFAGSLSLFFSINNSRAYVVIIKTAFVLGVLYTFLPFTSIVSPRFFLSRIGGTGSPALGASLVLSAFLYLNPFAFMWINAEQMMSPGTPIVVAYFYWPAHCVLMLCLSAVLLAWSVRVVRKVALGQATGQIEPNLKRRAVPKRKRRGTNAGRRIPAKPVRRVKGAPVLWKELRAPMIKGGDGRNSIIGFVLTVAALLITYAACSKSRCLGADFTHVSYAVLFVTVGIIFNIVFAAGTITTEKESRAWPILLATSMDDWSILLGKAGGVFRRCLPVWLLLAGHTVLFVCFRYIHPVAVFHLLLLVTWVTVFLTGSALYFSACFKRTTSAVVCSAAMALVLWAVAPLVLTIISEIVEHRSFLGDYLSANPLVQTSVIMAAAAGRFNARTSLSGLVYHWPTVYEGWSLGSATARLFTTMLLYVSAGLFLAWRARCRFRRNIF